MIPTPKLIPTAQLRCICSMLQYYVQRAVNGVVVSPTKHQRRDCCQAARFQGPQVLKQRETWRLGLWTKRSTLNPDHQCAFSTPPNKIFVSFVQDLTSTTSFPICNRCWVNNLEHRRVQSTTRLSFLFKRCHVGRLSRQQDPLLHEVDPIELQLCLILKSPVGSIDQFNELKFSRSGPDCNWP